MTGRERGWLLVGLAAGILVVILASTLFDAAVINSRAQNSGGAKVVAEQEGDAPFGYYLLGPKRASRAEADRDLARWNACRGAQQPAGGSDEPTGATGGRP